MPPFFDVHGDPNMDPYTILSLPPTASEAEIKKAYRMQMLQLHPDKLSPTLSEESIADVTEKFHNVKDAYEFLISPLHLTARRLYMTKMASRRAEYERREAYIRRNGGANTAAGYSQYTGGGVSGYASGGGGAAGMAGTGMHPPTQSCPPGRQGHSGGGGGAGGGGGNRNNSHAVPKNSSNMHRSKSEPQVDKHQGGRRSTMNHKNMGATGHHRRHTTYTGSRPRDGGNNNRGRERTNGYKSDSYATNAKSKSNNRESRGNNNKPRESRNSSGGKDRNQSSSSRQRGKSEPRRSEKRQTSQNKENRKSRNTTNRDSRDDRSRDSEEQRQRHRASRKERAKSAPARYANKNNRSSTYNNYSSKYDKNNPNTLPKEFYCPLTKRLMKDPVKDTEGNTYEREAIERWLRVQSSSPITNGYLSLDMLRPDRELKRAIYKATGKPRSKSTTRARKRSSSPAQDLVSGRVLIDSYLREISSRSKLSVSLDGMGVCAFSYRRITFVIEVPITPHAGFMVYSSFDGECSKSKLSDKMDAWNSWLANIGRDSRVTSVKAGQKTVFTLKGSENDMSKCDIFQKTLEYFVEMSLKLHNLLHPHEAKAVENVSLTKSALAVH